MPIINIKPQMLPIISIEIHGSYFWTSEQKDKERLLILDRYFQWDFEHQANKESQAGSLILEKW